ncbi:HAD hydrolase-like protein [Brooklawnia cerclae]|uniref:HAD superfamily hydrolase (TIGR01450 family) n=1 Tax=Brooklawnia cerclae TaxID=349934 RepID=A0ABX0SHC9_9ACTN|nr:HAD-IIA family hydrolase [Brooklawnia cerclae]NIH56122.1 HAD superfamily hydrolase (TIGR01450 family) [Brooklawnia cerclae]
MTRFIDAYDAAMFDLDGVVYLGPEPVKGSPETLSELRVLGVRIGFVTNNAGRSAEVVVEHLNSLGIECHREDVVTSTQAIAQLMLRELPTGAKVLVCGAQALADEMASVGFTLVDNYLGEPDAVVQGYDPQMSFPQIDDACFAIQRGARWFGTNTDINRPTHLGLTPGAGSQIACVQVCVDTEPMIAGKPYPPLLQETIKRIGAEHPVFVGDRLDTDIAGAHNVGIDSFLVFTGAHGKRELVAAVPQQRPTAIGHDLRGLVRPKREATWDGAIVRCQDAVATASSGQVHVEGPLDDVDQQLDALWAVVQHTWRDAGLDASAALDRLGLLS